MAEVLAPPDNRIELLARSVDAIPPLPHAVLEVMHALRRSDLSAHRSIELIECDQALAARTLRLANSAFYGVPGRVGSIGDAVRMLGLRTVAGVLAAIALHDTLNASACPGFHFEAYWRHAIGTALAARALSSHAGHDADESFLTGLMHDVGQLVLATRCPEQAAKAIALAHAGDTDRHAAEAQVLGTGHARVGAMVATHWHFPAWIARGIERHHQPEAAAGGQRISLSGLIQVADAMAHALDLNHDAAEAVPPIDPSVWHALNLAHDDALHLLATVEAGVLELHAALCGHPT